MTVISIFSKAERKAQLDGILLKKKESTTVNVSVEEKCESGDGVFQKNGSLQFISPLFSLCGIQWYIRMEFSRISGNANIFLCNTMSQRVRADVSITTNVKKLFSKVEQPLLKNFKSVDIGFSGLRVDSFGSRKESCFSISMTIFSTF